MNASRHTLLAAMLATRSGTGAASQSVKASGAAGTPSDRATPIATLDDELDEAWLSLIHI